VHLGRAATELPRNARNRAGVSAGPDEQQRSAADRNQRKTPFDRDRRRSQCLRHGHPEIVRATFFGAAEQNAHVGEVTRDGFEKLAFARIRLQQNDLSLGQSSRNGDTRRAAARADVDDRALEALDVGQDGQALVEMDATRFRGIADRGQPRRLDQPLEPSLEPGV
jgi:hypothetical protein